MPNPPECDQAGQHGKQALPAEEFQMLDTPNKQLITFDTSGHRWATAWWAWLTPGAPWGESSEAGQSPEQHGVGGAERHCRGFVRSVRATPQSWLRTPGAG